MKRILNIFLVLPIVLSGCSKAPKGIKFKSWTREFETYYDDSYFLKDNKVYSQEIALASYASAIATITDGDDFSVHGNYLVSLWENEGFTNIYLSETFHKKPEPDSIAYGFATKKIENFNLVAIAIRSGSYGAEWASNVTAGIEGNAKGFQDSCDIVLEDLYSYISSKNINSKTKFWLSGYSRGASVTNLAAAEILNNIKAGTFISSLETTKDDVYAYCFEPPLCANVPSDQESPKSELYNGIHSIVNFNDPVVKVFPHIWGFDRFGQTHYYPDRLTDINFDASERKKLVSDYHFDENGKDFQTYTIDDWQFHDVGAEAAEKYNIPRESIYPSMGRFSSELVKAVSHFSFFFNRESFDATFCQGFRDIFKTVYGYNEKIPGVKLSGTIFVDILFSYSFAQSMLAQLMAGDVGGFAYDLEFVFYLMFNATEENIEDVKNLYAGIYYFIIFAFTAISEFRKDLLQQLFTRDNLLMLALPHNSDLNYSFLRSCDTRINGKKACELNDGSYQVLHIKSPSKVSIYEHTLKKEMFTYADGVMSSDGLSAEKMADGSIDIYMPKNGRYTYKIESESISLGNIDEFGDETPINESMPKEGTF